MLRLGVFLFVLLSFTFSQVGVSLAASFDKKPVVSLNYEKGAAPSNDTNTDSDEGTSPGESEESVILRSPVRTPLFQIISKHTPAPDEELCTVNLSSIHRPPEKSKA